MNLRHLTTDETDMLVRNGCRCARWERIKVNDPFIATAYRNATFMGDIELHPAEGTVACGGVTFEAGISNAVIIDSVIGRGAHIANIGDFMARCVVGDGAVIRNTGTIDCRQETSHGAGTVVDVLSETGGREVPIYYGLTAREAWTIAMFRHDMATVDRLKDAISDRAAAKRCRRTIIGAKAVVTGAGYIDSMDIMAGAEVNGASRLVNGTVGEGAKAGCGVMASGFILARGAEVDTGARLDHVFVGEGSRVANGFSAHHSLIFSNCILENGEAAALFAGPYTVSMHKSTLLIGAMTSMFNAGSGANQSNHLYKSGPCHHGILERGVKLASDAYIMWPAHIGAFTTVMGRHKSHPDTSALPFSYIVETDGHTLVIPAIALGNIGVARDADKWPRRDRRPRPATDIITFPLLNPYTAQRISQGIDLLDSLLTSQPDTETLTCRGYVIKRPHAVRALSLYNIALRHYMLGTLLHRIADGLPLDAAETTGAGRWIDMAGAAIPAALVQAELPEASQWDTFSRQLEWDWIAARLATSADIDLHSPDRDALERLLDEWRQLDDKLTEMLRRDAAKEFDLTNPDMTAGFGLADPEALAADFTNARGTLDSAAAACLLKARREQADALSSAVKHRLDTIG